MKHCSAVFFSTLKKKKKKWPSCSKFQMCIHPRFTKSKAGKKLWLSPTSDAFKALQSNLNYLTKFSHTGILETFYALYNKWIPKSQHFSHLAMVTRIQLAIIDLNSDSDLPQAKTKGGQGKYNLDYLKKTKWWSSKPIKVKRAKHTTLTW